MAEIGHWTNPDFRQECHRVFFAPRPKYPRPLTCLEIIAQAERVCGDDLTILAEQFGGGGKLKSQFLNYISQCSCNCWASWRDAWIDFAVFMEFGKESR